MTTVGSEFPSILGHWEPLAQCKPRRPKIRSDRWWQELTRVSRWTSRTLWSEQKSNSGTFYSTTFNVNSELLVKLVEAYLWPHARRSFFRTERLCDSAASTPRVFGCNKTEGVLERKTQECKRGPLQFLKSRILTTMLRCILGPTAQKAILKWNETQQSGLIISQRTQQARFSPETSEFVQLIKGILKMNCQFCFNLAPNCNWPTRFSGSDRTKPAIANPTTGPKGNAASRKPERVRRTFCLMSRDGKSKEDRCFQEEATIEKKMPFTYVHRRVSFLDVLVHIGKGHTNAWTASKTVKNSSKNQQQESSVVTSVFALFFVTPRFVSLIVWVAQQDFSCFVLEKRLAKVWWREIEVRSSEEKYQGHSNKKHHDAQNPWFVASVANVTHENGCARRHCISNGHYDSRSDGRKAKAFLNRSHNTKQICIRCDVYHHNDENICSESLNACALLQESWSARSESTSSQGSVHLERFTIFLLTFMQKLLLCVLFFFCFIHCCQKFEQKPSEIKEGKHSVNFKCCWKDVCTTASECSCQ